MVASFVSLWKWGEVDGEEDDDAQVINNEEDYLINIYIFLNY